MRLGAPAVAARLRACPRACAGAATLLAPAVALVVVSVSALLLPPNPPMAQIAIARGLAELAAACPLLADPGYATPRAHPATITLAHPVDGVRFDYLAHVAVPSLPFWGQRDLARAVRGDPGAAARAVRRRARAPLRRLARQVRPRDQAAPALGLYEQLRVALGTEQPGWPAAATLRLPPTPASPSSSSTSRRAHSRARRRRRARVRRGAGAHHGRRRPAIASAPPPAATAASRSSFPYASVNAQLELRCAAGTRVLEISDAAVEQGGEVTADCSSRRPRRSPDGRATPTLRRAGAAAAATTTTPPRLATGRVLAAATAGRHRPTGAPPPGDGGWSLAALAHQPVPARDLVGDLALGVRMHELEQLQRIGEPVAPHQRHRPPAPLLRRHQPPLRRPGSAAPARRRAARRASTARSARRAAR